MAAPTGNPTVSKRDRKGSAEGVRNLLSGNICKAVRALYEWE